MLSLHHHQLMGKIEEHEGKKYFIVDDYMIDKILDKIKEIIGVEKFNDTNILINTAYKLSTNITLENVLILMTCAVKMMLNCIHKYFQKKHF